MSSSTTTKTITVERRGGFNDDPFFQDSWSEWDRAMKDAVGRWEKHTGTNNKTSTYLESQPSETPSVYRQIRSSNVTSDESQAVSCVEEEQKYKLVLDVKDFSPADINVKAVDNNVVVEGKIEKNEGGSVSTQTFVRKFHLPATVNMSGVSSALSRDGVLTINAPKMVSAITKGSSQTVPIHRTETTTTRLLGSTEKPTVTTYHNYPAGKPTNKDNAAFNPSGSIVNTYFAGNPNAQPSTNNRITETITVSVPDRRGTEKVIKTVTESRSDNWDTFNEMVERSQKEMEDMMKHHTIHSTTEALTTTPPTPSSALVSAPAGATTTRDVVKSGNVVTERQEQRWNDNSKPGVQRTNRAASEISKINDPKGNLVGNKQKHEQESRTEGSKEEILPDGTKCKIFTKTYETKNSFKSCINNGKDL